MKKYDRQMLKQEFNIIDDKIYIDLGCGGRKQKGYLGVDISRFEGVDVVCNIEEELPLEDNTVDGIYANFLFEHIKNFIPFMQELYRICRNGAIIKARFPYWASITQWKDPTHKQVITVETFRYFSEDRWYGSDYGINTNFRVKSVEYCYLPPFSSKRWFFLFPFRKFFRRHLINIVHSVWLQLEVVKEFNS